MSASPTDNQPTTEAGQRLDMDWPGSHLDRIEWQKSIAKVEQAARAAVLREVAAKVRGAALIHLQRGGYCIDCGQQQRDGHGDDCAVARFLNDPHVLLDTGVSQE